MKPEVRRYPTLSELTRAAAEFVCSLARESAERRGLFTVALSGGSTPKTLYEDLARPPFSARMPWPHIHFFWGDERCVPPDHPDSNFAMAFRALVSKPPIPPQNVHRVPAEGGTPHDAAQTYEKMLREFFRFSNSSHASHQGESFPSFDLVLLGVGKDGHTASLFPGDQALEERKRWVAAVDHPHGSPPVPRITLTFPVINSAKCTLFLVSGAGKQEVLRSILENPDSAAQRYPAARVSPQGKVVWMIDERAV